MLVRQVIQAIRRIIHAAPGRSSKAAHEPPIHPRARPEFPQVNALAGAEPVRPELSGLQIHHPVGMSRRVAQLLISLAYRWQPSGEYQRRQGEMRRMNLELKYQPKTSIPVPPILMYPEETEVAPTRLEPQRGIDQPAGGLFSLGELPRDLRDLEALERLRTAPVIQPRLPETDQQYLLTYRPLLPRQYRDFMRFSPYPRLVGAAFAVAAATVGVLWMSQLQQAEATALGRYHVARNAFRTELEAARTYGVDPRLLRPLEAHSRQFDALSAPEALIAGRAKTRFYSAQARSYTALLRVVRRLEKRAWDYWSWRETESYATLAMVAQDASSLGLPAALSPIPACGTPRCYRLAVRSQEGRARWLRQTAATLRVYGAEIASSADPVTAAGMQVQEARNLQALLPGWAVAPARLASLDGMLATASDQAGYARAGALGHLDVDALRADLVRALPAQAVVISTEEQQLVCYRHGKVVLRSPVTADAGTPDGTFHIQAKQASISTMYWSHQGGSSSYRYGSLPDWMPFSSNAALQAAPWRTMFGPGSDAAQASFAPSTPGSVDLPQAAADFLFGWTSVGTEVVVY